MRNWDKRKLWGTAAKGATWGVLSAGVLLVGCSFEPRVPDDPMKVMGDELQPALVRQAAVKQARELAGNDPVAISAVAESMEDVINSSKTPPEVRRAALTSLLEDANPAVQARAREVLKKRLPTEDTPRLVAMMCSAAADKGWSDCIPAIVQSYARDNAPGTTDEERPERSAIQKLAQGQGVAQAVFAVFLNPPKQEARYGVKWTGRLQRDAWQVLCRLDASGEQRSAFVMGAQQGNADGTAAVEAIRACRADLRAMPNSGDELAWLLSLRNEHGKENAAWWGETAAGVARVPQAVVLELRHAETVRWAAANHPELLGTSQGELLAMLRDRLNSRHAVEHAGAKKLYRESLYGQEERLSWGDCLSILVLDDVLRQPGVPSILWQQALLDLNDTRAGWGGAWVTKRGSRSGYVPVVYPPRPAQRRGDLEYAPTDDMISQCDLALAFYSFHAWKTRNQDAAGPEPSDLARVARLRRNELLLTPLSERRFNVDVVLPTGVVIDIGILEVPKE